MNQRYFSFQQNPILFVDNKPLMTKKLVITKNSLFFGNFTLNNSVKAGANFSRTNLISNHNSSDFGSYRYLSKSE
jgi:hypothetical protein